MIRLRSRNFLRVISPYLHLVSSINWVDYRLSLALLNVRPCSRRCGNLPLSVNHNWEPIRYETGDESTGVCPKDLHWEWRKLLFQRTPPEGGSVDGHSVGRKRQQSEHGHRADELSPVSPITQRTRRVDGESGQE